MRPQCPPSIGMCSLVAVVLAVTALAAQAQEPPTASSTAADPPSASSTAAHGPEPVSLDELLDLVETGFHREREANKVREARFVRAKEEQAERLQEIRDRVATEEARSARRENTFSTNETALAQLEDNLE